MAATGHVNFCFHNGFQALSGHQGSVSQSCDKLLYR